jgi:hypothetical protein
VTLGLSIYRFFVILRPALFAGRRTYGTVQRHSLFRRLAQILRAKSALRMTTVLNTVLC